MKTSVTQLFARKALVTALASATLCGSVGFISSAYAQETTAVIRGIVTDMSGDPVQEAEVTITSEGTGITRTVTTDENGSYYVRNLPAGVAYTITADAPGLQKAITEEQSLTVGQTAILNYALSAEEEVLVVAQAIQSANTAIGPNAVFDLQTLQ